MPKYFHIVYSGGEQYPVRDDEAHESLESLSSKFTTHTSDTSAHVTNDEKLVWNAKQDELEFSYTDDGKINAINNSALAGGGSTEYTAGDYIDPSELSAGEISVTGLLSTEEFSGTISNYLTTSAASDTYQLKLSDEQLENIESVTSKLDRTEFSEVSGSFLTAHQSLDGYATEDYVTSALSEKVDTSTLNDYYKKTETSSTSEISSALDLKLDKSDYESTTASFRTEIAESTNITVTSADGESGQLVYTLSSHNPANLYSNNNSITVSADEDDPQRFNIETNLPAADFGSFYSDSVELSTTSDYTNVPMITLYTSDSLSSLSELQSNVLYHIDVNLEVTRSGESLTDSYETLVFRDNTSENTTRTFSIGPLDASTTQPQYFNISYDVRLVSSLAVWLLPESAGWSVKVIRYDIHDVNGGLSPGSTESMAADLATVSEKVNAITTTVEKRIITNMPFALVTDSITTYQGSGAMSCVGLMFTPVMTQTISKTDAVFAMVGAQTGSGKYMMAIYEYDFNKKQLAWVCNSDWQNMSDIQMGYYEFPITNFRDDPTIHSSMVYYSVMFTTGNVAKFGGAPASTVNFNVIPRLGFFTDNLSNVEADALGTTYQTLTSQGESLGFKFFLGIRNT